MELQLVTMELQEAKALSMLCSSLGNIHLAAKAQSKVFSTMAAIMDSFFS